MPPLEREELCGCLGGATKRCSPNLGVPLVPLHKANRVAIGEARPQRPRPCLCLELVAALALSHGFSGPSLAPTLAQVAQPKPRLGTGTGRGWASSWRGGEESEEEGSPAALLLRLLSSSPAASLLLLAPASFPFFHLLCLFTAPALPKYHSSFPCACCYAGVGCSGPGAH